MPILTDWHSADLSAVWHDFLGPLIALAVALVLTIAGRFLRSGLLVAAAAGAGVVAGWFAIGGRPWSMAPHGSLNRLTLIATVALVVGLLQAQLARNRGMQLGRWLVAAFTGWWLGGAPSNLPELLQNWPVCLGISMAVLLAAHSLATDAASPLRLVLTGLIMAVSFHVATLRPIWSQMALVPAAASLAPLAAPRLPEPVALPIAVSIVAVGCMAVIAFGGLPHLRVTPVDVAAMAPLFALWLTPRLASQLGVAARSAAASASALAALIAIGSVWIAVRTLGR
jgi:hypothetical protein